MYALGAGDGQVVTHSSVGAIARAHRDQRIEGASRLACDDRDRHPMAGIMTRARQAVSPHARHVRSSAGAFDSTHSPPPIDGTAHPDRSSMPHEKPRAEVAGQACARS
jgi:hypothetical protein